MSAYLIGRMNITNNAQYDSYRVLTPKIVEQFGGKFLTRGGSKISLEGKEDQRRFVIVEFPAMSNAQAFYESEEYQKARSMRKDAAENVEIFITEGFESII